MSQDNLDGPWPRPAIRILQGEYVSVARLNPEADVDDLFARMLVLDGWRFRADVDAVLDELAAGDAEIVPLEIGARDSGLLRSVLRSGAGPLRALARDR